LNSALWGEQRIFIKLITAAAARGSATAATAGAFARLVAITAKHRTITTWFERHRCWLAAAGTNYGCSLRRSGTVAGAPPLVVLFCLTAVLAAFWSRITTFLEERLICSSESEVLPAIAARK